MLLLSLLRHLAGDEEVVRSLFQELLNAIMCGEGLAERCSEKRGRLEFITERLANAGAVELTKAIVRLHAECTDVQRLSFEFLNTLVEGVQEARREERIL